MPLQKQQVLCALSLPEGQLYALMPPSQSCRPLPPATLRDRLASSFFSTPSAFPALFVACPPIPLTEVAGIEFQNFSFQSRGRVAELCSSRAVGQKSSQGLGCKREQLLCKRPDCWALPRPGQVQRLCVERTSIRAENNSACALCSQADLWRAILLSVTVIAG